MSLFVWHIWRECCRPIIANESFSEYYQWKTDMLHRLWSHDRRRDRNATIIIIIIHFVNLVHHLSSLWHHPSLTHSLCACDSTPTVLIVSVDIWHGKSCVLLLLLLLSLSSIPGLKHTCSARPSHNRSSPTPRTAHRNTFTDSVYCSTFSFSFSFLLFQFTRVLL